MIRSRARTTTAATRRTRRPTMPIAGLPRAPAVRDREDDPTAAEEATAAADLPPDLVREQARDENGHVIPNAPPQTQPVQLESEIRDLEQHLDRLLEQVAAR